jgi:HK97 family phage major capsid protein
MLGGPAQMAQPTLWGKPVVLTTALTAGTGLVGGFQRGARLWLNSGVDVYVSDSHKDWFQRNVLALLAEIRAAFGVLRPDAFATVTAI